MIINKKRKINERNYSILKLQQSTRRKKKKKKNGKKKRTKLKTKNKKKTYFIISIITRWKSNINQF